ncbi:uncharacterized protein I303_107696 [Kwoniella dejecticola CBS 10117]|uniref:Uncharacterized protein n=1 Tax=Kwoniella dejecticola CBS 10117 TaxID=1296121 RepID=A0A1A5ZVF5_9TREE|nr:uncharacterized protein I303_07705 [Kwoniella dejecticola CBS 10117]OBR81795.1 hypothetical protein I303_07705 [Kwoniella dejecticola CBS 10117]
MSVETTYITPITPDTRVLKEGVNRIPISPLSLWPVDTIPSAYVFPSKLDVTRLKRAIEMLSGFYPTIAGRFERDQEGFFFNLTRSPIPFETQTISSKEAFPFPDKRVIQETLDPYLPNLGQEFPLTGANKPLFVIRLTTSSDPEADWSVLGVSWGHILGDAAACLIALKWLELFYVYGSLEGAVDQKGSLGIPVYGEGIKLLKVENDEIHFSPPKKNSIPLQEYTYLKGYTIPEGGKLYAKTREGTERVDLILSLSEVGSLTKSVKDLLLVREEGSYDKNMVLSTQDILTGWFVSLLRRSGQGIKEVIYVCDFRRFCQSDPAVPPNFADQVANSAQFRTISLPDNHNRTNSTSNPFDEIFEIAKTIRKEIINLRSDPYVCFPWLTNVAYHLEKSAKAGLGQYVIPDEGGLEVNSHIRADWHLDFGFPAYQTSFHCFDTHIRFLRIYQSNPTENGEKSLEFALRVPVESKSGFEELISKDRASWRSGSDVS